MKLIRRWETVERSMNVMSMEKLRHEWKLKRVSWNTWNHCSRHLAVLYLKDRWFGLWLLFVLLVNDVEIRSKGSENSNSYSSHKIVGYFKILPWSPKILLFLIKFDGVKSDKVCKKILASFCSAWGFSFYFFVQRQVLKMKNVFMIRVT